MASRCFHLGGRVVDGDVILVAGVVALGLGRAFSWPKAISAMGPRRISWKRADFARLFMYDIDVADFYMGSIIYPLVELPAQVEISVQ